MSDEPRIENLPSYIGMGWVDPHSIRETRGSWLRESRVTFDVANGEDLVYRVDWRPNYCEVEEYLDLQRVSLTRDSTLSRAFQRLTVSHQLSASKTNIPPSWIRLARVVSDRAYVTFPHEVVADMAYFPAMEIVDLQVLVPRGMEVPVASHPSPRRPPGSRRRKVQLKATRVDVAAIVYDWEEGLITALPMLLVHYWTPMLFVDDILHSLGPLGEKPARKEFRAIVERVVVGMGPGAQFWKGDREELDRYALVHADSESLLDNLVDAVAKSMLRPTEVELPE